MSLLKYFIRKYHSPELSPKDLKGMLNWWLPFIFNRIKITFISDDFLHITVKLKHTIWNRNPNKSLWGGSMFSAADPFFPIMLKQRILQNGYKTDFFTKATKVEYLKEAKTSLIFDFKITENELDEAMSKLVNEQRYESWFTVFGVDELENKCVKANVQVYLRLRN